jgi:hypothetical protein
MFKYNLLLTLTTSKCLMQQNLSFKNMLTVDYQV